MWVRKVLLFVRMCHTDRRHEKMYFNSRSSFVFFFCRMFHNQVERAQTRGDEAQSKFWVMESAFFSSTQKGEGLS